MKSNENQNEGKAKEGTIQDIQATVKGTTHAYWRVPKAGELMSHTTDPGNSGNLKKLTPPRNGTFKTD